MLAVDRPSCDAVFIGRDGEDFNLILRKTRLRSIEFEMKRWIWFCGCAVAGLLLLGVGLLVPAHLRAVDVSVLRRAGDRSTSLVDRGLQLLKDQQLGAAQLLSRAAQEERLSGRERLSFEVANLDKESPQLRILGAPEARLAELVTQLDLETNSVFMPFTDLLIRLQNQGKLTGFLQASTPVVKELLQFRSATNTAIFPPSWSASGQALDAALSTCGILLESGSLTPSLSNTVYSLAAKANRGGDSQPLEQVLVNLMSLGQRFNWDQLRNFVHAIPDAETLRRLAGLTRKAADQLPVLFSAVVLSGRPAAVAAYALNFSRTGLKDLASSLHYGEGAVNELLSRNQRLYESELGPPLATGLCLGAPRLALCLKWVLYFAGGFLLALAVHFARPLASALERPLQVSGFHLARELLFALSFLLVVVLLSEPFLAQENQRMELPFQLRVPVAGGTVPAGTQGVNSSFMNQTNILTMLLFFVLQGLLYTASVLKLAEIRRQKVAPRMKLKLLENEEHLFDAGLYLGFLGTIISFIVYSLFAHHSFSLMVAYSSTSFGILFVSFFKIFHLRPVRRRLLLQAEVESPDSLAHAASPTLA